MKYFYRSGLMAAISMCSFSSAIAGVVLPEYTTSDHIVYEGGEIHTLNSIGGNSEILINHGPGLGLNNYGAVYAGAFVPSLELSSVPNVGGFPTFRTLEHQSINNPFAFAVAGSSIPTKIDSDSQIDYSFEIVSPSGIPMPVSVDASYVLDVATSSDESTYNNPLLLKGTASAAFEIATPAMPGSPQRDIVLEGFTTCPGNSIEQCILNENTMSVKSGIVNFLVNSDTVYSVMLSTSVSASYGMTSVAIADPYLYIDPTTPDAAGFTAHFSSGIGNSLFSSSVPEPSEWALMIVGFGVLGVTMRSRRSSATILCRDKPQFA